MTALLIVRAPGDDDISEFLGGHTELLEGGLDKVDILVKNLETEQ